MKCTFQIFYSISYIQSMMLHYLHFNSNSGCTMQFFLQLNDWNDVHTYFLAFHIIMQGQTGRPTQFQTKESFEKDFDEWIKAAHEVCVNLRSITHNFGSAKLMNVSSIWVAVTWKGFGITSPFDNWRAVFLFFQFPSINIMYVRSIRV